VGQLKEFIFDDKTTYEDIDWVSQGLTSEMIAGVAKLCSNMDLVAGAAKIRRVATPTPPSACPGH